MNQVLIKQFIKIKTKWKKFKNFRNLTHDSINNIDDSAYLTMLDRERMIDNLINMINHTNA
jgi:hypothetical protein